MAFADTVRRASWRGVPFGVEVGSQMAGRRKVRHDYPYRDSVWLEDQGKLPQRFRILGFLIANSAVYGGGDLASQVKRMAQAAEATGPGVLVHPTRGRLTVDLEEPVIITERWDEGGLATVELAFIQGGTQVFPSIAGALGDLVGQAASLADAAGLSAFAGAVLDPLKNGVSAITSMSATAGEWVDKVQGLARDATSLYGTVSQLGGANFGRYFNGRNSGFLAGLVSPYAGASSVTDLINLGAANRTRIGTAGQAIGAAIGALGVTTTPADVAASVQAHVASLQASAANPSDAVRLLNSLAAFAPISSAARAPAGVAMSDLFQRSAAAAIARASAAYAPASAEDASAVRATVLAPVEAAIERAGGMGADEVFLAFRGLRKSVVEDLAQRGGGLARLADVELATAEPSVVIAQRRYADAARADELVIQADPVHPWFMPLAFRALAN